jgi:hypothetical protein
MLSDDTAAVEGRESVLITSETLVLDLSTT